MAAAPVSNFNSPVFAVPPFYANGGPSLRTQRNGNMAQSTPFFYYNKSLYTAEDPSPDVISDSERWTTLSAVLPMEPGAGRFPDVETYSRRNQNPRTMMDYAIPPYGNARGEKSLISWSENTPEPIMKVTNQMAIKRQRTRERMCKF